MRKLIIGLVLATLLTMATVVPASAIVHIKAPVCNAISHAGFTAGGLPAAQQIINKNPVMNPPMPAQGAANSGTNSPGAVIPGVGCP